MTTTVISIAGMSISIILLCIALWRNTLICKNLNKRISDIERQRVFDLARPILKREKPEWEKRADDFLRESFHQLHPNGIRVNAQGEIPIVSFECQHCGAKWDASSELTESIKYPNRMVEQMECPTCKRKVKSDKKW